MKTGLEHLPENKRLQLQAIVAAVRNEVPAVDMIVLFGSYARGDWVEDHETRYFSDFDLMVVVEAPSLAQDAAVWQGVSDELRHIGGHIPITLVAHDIHELNQEIRTGQYFFADVLREGILLFDSRRHTLAKPKALTTHERLGLAQYNFRYWFGSASGFWRGAGYYMADGSWPHAAFLLHQATERYFHAALLVFTGYKPKSHDIGALWSQTVPLHEALDWALPHNEGVNAHLFQLLRRAYIEARYNKAYRITLDELGALRRHILDLAERTQRACSDKLREFASIAGVDDIGELPPLPALSDTVEMPQLPALDDRKAVEAWRGAIVQLSQEIGERRGEERGREEGLREGERIGEERGRQEGERIGEARGRLQERANAILDVLQRRGLTFNDAQCERITTCRDEAVLARWWDLAWTVGSIGEMIDGD